MNTTERPFKKRRISNSTHADADLRERRARNDFRLKSIFESIFEKYGKDFDGIGDEIDMETGRIVVDNGHLLHMRDEKDPGGAAITSEEESEPDLEDVDPDLLWDFPESPNALSRHRHICGSEPNTKAKISQPAIYKADILVESTEKDELAVQSQNLRKGISAHDDEEDELASSEFGWASAPKPKSKPIDHWHLHEYGNPFSSQDIIEPAWRVTNLPPARKSSNFSSVVKASIGDIEDDSDLEPENVSIWAPEAVKRQTTGSRAFLERRWTQEEDRILNKLKMTTALSWPEMEPYFPRRHWQAIAAHWQYMLKTGRCDAEGKGPIQKPPTIMSTQPLNPANAAQMRNVGQHHSDNTKGSDEERRTEQSKRPPPYVGNPARESNDSIKQVLDNDIDPLHEDLENLNISQDRIIVNESLPNTSIDDSSPSESSSHSQNSLNQPKHDCTLVVSTPTADWLEKRRNPAPKASSDLEELVPETQNVNNSNASSAENSTLGSFEQGENRLSRHESSVIKQLQRQGYAYVSQNAPPSPRESTMPDVKDEPAFDCKDDRILHSVPKFQTQDSVISQSTLPELPGPDSFPISLQESSSQIAELSTYPEPSVGRRTVPVPDPASTGNPREQAPQTASVAGEDGTSQTMSRPRSLRRHHITAMPPTYRQCVKVVIPMYNPFLSAKRTEHIEKYDKPVCDPLPESQHDALGPSNPLKEDLAQSNRPSSTIKPIILEIADSQATSSSSLEAQTQGDQPGEVNSSMAGELQTQRQSPKVNPSNTTRRRRKTRPPITSRRSPDRVALVSGTSKTQEGLVRSDPVIANEVEPATPSLELQDEAIAVPSTDNPLPSNTSALLPGASTTRAPATITESQTVRCTSKSGPRLGRYPKDFPSRIVDELQVLSQTTPVRLRPPKKYPKKGQSEIADSFETRSPELPDCSDDELSYL